MNEEQQEELEALQYLFLEGELLSQEANILELCIPLPELPRPLSFQVIWPENYPQEPLVFSLTDSRVPEALKRQIETHASQVAEENVGDAATYLVYDSVKENLEDWGVLEELLKTETESHEQISAPKTQPLTKAQKRKQYKYVDSSGEKLRGWNWIDIISHLSKKGC